MRAKRADYDVAKRGLAEQINKAITPVTSVLDWQQKDDEQRRMRQSIKRCFRRSGHDDEAAIETIATEIVDLAKMRIDP